MSHLWSSGSWPPLWKRRNTREFGRSEIESCFFPLTVLDCTIYSEKFLLFITPSCYCRVHRDAFEWILLPKQLFCVCRGSLCPSVETYGLLPKKLYYLHKIKHIEAPKLEYIYQNTKIPSYRIAKYILLY